MLGKTLILQRTSATLTLTLAFGYIGCSAAPQLSKPLVEPYLVDVGKLDRSISIDMRYFSGNNFVGERVDGYLVPRCLLVARAAEALVKVQRNLGERGYGLLIYDCYRPQRAVDHFVRWANDLSDLRTKARHYPSIDKSRLFELGYIAEKSGHSRGSTVDLTVGRENKDRQVVPLDMGTDYDFFDPASHTESEDVSDDELQNRLLLRKAMESGGFENYPKEWWHYTLKNEAYPNSYWDVPVN